MRNRVGPGQVAALLFLGLAGGAMAQQPAIPAAMPPTCGDPAALQAGRAQTAAAENLIPAALLEAALTRLAAEGCRTGGRHEIAVVDFARISASPRLWLVNLDTGARQATPVHVAHGKGSDPRHTGTARLFGDEHKTGMSSLGAFRGGSRYTGKHGRSVALDGLDPTNSQARSRFIVIHSTSPSNDYVSAAYLRLKNRLGRSCGCFVVRREVLTRLSDVVRDGGFLFAGLSVASDSPLPARGDFPECRK